MTGCDCTADNPTPPRSGYGADWDVFGQQWERAFTRWPLMTAIGARSLCLEAAPHVLRRSHPCVIVPWLDACTAVQGQQFKDQGYVRVRILLRRNMCVYTNTVQATTSVTGPARVTRSTTPPATLVRAGQLLCAPHGMVSARGPQLIHCRFSCAGSCSSLVLAAAGLTLSCVPAASVPHPHPHHARPTTDECKHETIHAGGECGVPYAARYYTPPPFTGEPRGPRTSYYSFNAGPVHFLLLDSESPGGPGSPQGRCGGSARVGWWWAQALEGEMIV